MIKIIYLSGLYAGLIFPLVDALLNRYSKLYQEVGGRHSESFTRIYREGPFHYKLIAAIIPVFNLIWVFGLILIIRLYLLELREIISVFCIKKLARKPHKHFIIKHRIVKLLFKSYLDVFYTLCEQACLRREKNLKIIRSMLDIIDSLTKEKTDQQKQKDKENEYKTGNN